MPELALPAFELDCRDWLVVAPEEAGLPTDDVDSPLLAVLSTMVIEEDICEATGALTVGLMDDEPLQTRAVAPGAAARELYGADGVPGRRRFVMAGPAPSPLALVAEFVVGDTSDDILDDRVDALMCSFRWQDE